MGRRALTAVCGIATLTVIAVLSVFSASGTAQPQPQPQTAPPALPPPAALPAPAAAHRLRFGVIPYVDRARLEQDFAPLRHYLRAERDFDLDVSVSRGYGDVVTKLAAGEIDAAMLSAVLYVRARAKLGTAIEVVGAAVPWEPETGRGLILALADGGVRSLMDARGKRVAWVDPDSSTGYVFPRVQLTRMGGHDKAVDALLAGQVDVAAVWDVYWRDVDEAQRRRVVVLARTALVPADALVVRRDLAAPLRKAAVDALLGLRDQSARRVDALTHRLSIRGFEPASDADYEELRTSLKAAGLL
jgi:phosphonate transport system substrate-binding protein